LNDEKHECCDFTGELSSSPYQEQMAKVSICDVGSSHRLRAALPRYAIQTICYHQQQQQQQR
jgi:hypothetical protein